MFHRVICDMAEIKEKTKETGTAAYVNTPVSLLMVISTILIESACEVVIRGPWIIFSLCQFSWGLF